MNNSQLGIIIGLTGQTGAGKTSVGQLLTEAGCEVIDTDKIAREITEKGSPVLMTLAGIFGEDILEKGELNRKLLASRAFSSPENTEKLNAATHPEITKRVEKRIEEAFESGKKAAVIDAAALFESGEDKLCDFTVAVVCPEEIRLERIMGRDSITEEQAKVRIKAQRDEQYYIHNADMIIRNYPPFDLEEQTGGVIARMESEAYGKKKG